MTPPKRQKANIKKILDNPVQSKAQEILRPKKEGFWGWLSYLGLGLLITPFISYFGLFFPYGIFPIYAINEVDYFEVTSILSIIGLILTVIIMIKFRNYHSIGMFFISFLVTSVIVFIYQLKTYIGTHLIYISPYRCIYSFCFLFLYFYSVLWYLCYFYKRSKVGYHYVWLKVLLFPVLHFLFLFFIGRESSNCVFCQVTW